MTLPKNIKNTPESFQAISKILEEFRTYINEHERELQSWNIDTDCLDWHIDCVEMCADRVAFKLLVK